MNYLALWLLSFWPPATPQPRPDLTPADVVRIVVAALQNSNSPIPNAGVFTTYRFASAANHAATGPYGHFLMVVKSIDFAPLLRNSRSETGSIVIWKDSAEQVVTVHLNRDRVVSYKFNLSRQTAGPDRGCWLVDGVTREPSPAPGV